MSDCHEECKERYFKIVNELKEKIKTYVGCKAKKVCKKNNIVNLDHVVFNVFGLLIIDFLESVSESKENFLSFKENLIGNIDAVEKKFDEKILNKKGTIQ